jgi:hypothetical protein
MREGVLGADESSRASWAAAKGSLIVAALSALGLTVVGHPRVGVALASGFVLGAFTGVLALQSLHSGLPFRVTSLSRLAVQSVLAIGIGYLLGTDVIWVPVLGLVGSNVILAVVAVRGTLAQ